MLRRPHGENGSSLIREVLRDRRGFGKGPPHWTLGRAEQPAESAQTAQARREATIAGLQRQGGKNAKAQALARRLEACDPRSRCGSGACPECARAYQRWFVWSGAQLLKTL